MFKLTLRMRLALAATATLALTAMLLTAVLQPGPSVSMTENIAQADISRVLNIVRENDPRRTASGQLSNVVLHERDIDLLLNHIAYRRLGVPIRVTLERGRAHIDSSLHLPSNVLTRTLGHWINVRATLRDSGGLPEVAALSIGRLPLPTFLAVPLARQTAGLLGLAAETELVADVLRQVNFFQRQVVLSYVLRRDSAERIVAGLVPQAEQDRLKAYSDRLVALAESAARQPERSAQSLAAWIGPMFELAQQRSAAGGDAVAENRAAIVVLTLYANGQSLDRLLPAARNWPRARPQRLTLAGRDDSPLHLLISAALVVEGTGPLSRAVGLYKEVADSRGGSGFSFNDLAADRAGTRLGEMALQQPGRLQAALAGGVRETDFMPHAADLPEGMPESEFKLRFGAVGSPRYAAMVGEIDRRISALPALR